jgi:eukaryotic-like serine/threonine-protein kinase
MPSRRRSAEAIAVSPEPIMTDQPRLRTHPEAAEDGAGSELSARIRRAKPTPSALQQARYAQLFGRRVLCPERRVEIIRRIGGGSMGTVYEARYAGSPVALKALNNLTPQQIYGLKKEFRMLASVAHPNVVTAYHLFAADHGWYFTMELVDGLTLTARWLELVRAQRESGYTPALEGKLRGLLQQLIEGVAATHLAGLVHRDLKPANVLVNQSGRLVIVDFGLVSSQEAGGAGQTIEQTIAGTPAYMAPEQAVGLPASTASDWYAVGVMLFELLTGQLPPSWRLSPLQSDTRKALSPAGVRPCVPEDLDLLCQALTEPEPSRRPTTERMLAVCRSWNIASEQQSHAWVPPLHGPSFVGRARELELLTAGHLEARAGRPQWLLVEGDSGVGKTALLREFAARIRASADALVLEGRCAEQESLPHRGLDGVIDHLTRVLLQLEPEQAALLVPRHAAALTWLFPVLLRVPCLRAAASGVTEEPAPEVRRAQALDGLTELLCRITDRRALVLIIDDMHWADAQSLELLRVVLTAHDAPRMLLVAAHRNSISGRVEEVCAALPESLARKLQLSKLSEAEAQELVASVLAEKPASAPASPALSAEIAREAQGMPLYVAELARSARAQGDGGSASLSELMQQRLERLPARTRRAFDMLVAAGRPLPTAVLARAAGLCDLHQPLATLRKARLTRLVDESHGQAMDVYHHRIRDACLALMDQQTICDCRTRLADALADESEAGPAWIAELFASIGERAQAAQYLLELAQSARAESSFDQAAALLARALQLLETSSAPVMLADIHQLRARMLVNAGQTVESARALAQALRLYAQSDQLWRACTASLASLHRGQVPEALHLLERALERVSLAWPLRRPRLGIRLRQP